jgi:Tol biopolymer transport system component
VRVSRGEGRWPQWSPAGDEIYFWSGDGWIMAVPIQTEPELSIGEPRGLFESAGYTSSGGTEHWDIAPDGRFLMLKEHQTLPPLARVHVVINWVEELKQQVPEGR